MKATSNFRYFIALLFLLGCLVGIGPGCNDDMINSRFWENYRFEGVLVQDMNSDSVIIAAALRRQDTTVTDAEVRFDDAELIFNAAAFVLDSVYSYCDDSLTVFAAGEHWVAITNDRSFGDSVLNSVPDTFSISNVVPSNHQLQGAEVVSLEWDISANAERYVVAAVKAGSAYTGQGYSAPVASLINAGTIEQDAFISSQTGEPDTGLYNVYVYALNGSPDSALADQLLPVPLPSQLDDNIEHLRLSGDFGSVCVTRADTVRVTIR